jgi:hypothetical protein
MHSFAKRLIFTLLLAAGLMGLCQSAEALEAILLQRQPLCTKALPQCVGVFNLNQNEKVEVMGQSEDQNYLHIRYQSNGQMGWIPANSARLILPSAFKTQEIFKFETNTKPVFVLGAQKKQILSGKQLYEIETKSDKIQPVEKLRFLNSGADLLSPCFTATEQIACVKSVEMEKQHYLQLQTEVKTQSYPNFQTLLRQEKANQIFQLAFEPLFALQGLGTGPWGHADLMLYAGAGAEIRALLPNTRDIFAFVPENLRGKIRVDTIEMVALESTGILHVIAGQFARKEKLLLRFQITAEPPWKYLGQIIWPEEQPWSQSKEKPLIQVVSKGQDTWLALAPPSEPQNFELYFFSVANQALFHTPVHELRGLWLDVQARLWSLEGDKLIQRTAIFEEKKE